MNIGITGASGLIGRKITDLALTVAPTPRLHHARFWGRHTPGPLGV
jgi:hypothetical protein